MTIKQKGIIGIPLVLVFALGTVGTTYFVNLISTNTKITDAKEELNTDLSLTNQRVSVVETQVSSILKSQESLEDKFDRLFNSLINKEI